MSGKIEQKIIQKGKDHDDFIESLSVEELKDLRQIILASEYLLTKYKDKKDIKLFLEEFIGVLLHASNSVNSLKNDLEDLVVSAEVAFHQIQHLHDEVTHNLELGHTVQTRLDDYGLPLKHTPSPVVSIVEQKAETSSINLTNSSRRVNTSDYLERTAVEI
ncbi:MAG: hypothetical protein ABI340_01395 [Nitrososphaera sp.]